MHRAESFLLAHYAEREDALYKCIPYSAFGADFSPGGNLNADNLAQLGIYFQR